MCIIVELVLTGPECRGDYSKEQHWTSKYQGKPAFFRRKNKSLGTGMFFFASLLLFPTLQNSSFTILISKH